MTEWERWAILALAAGVLVMALLWRRALSRIGRANRRRHKVAQRGEEQAEWLLRRAGYRVLDRQVTGRWHLFVDGKRVEVSARADLLVRRRGRTWVAEVKTGDRAPDPTTPATRRQLLEYLHAFDVDGALLVDMSTRRIRVVAFGA